MRTFRKKLSLIISLLILLLVCGMAIFTYVKRDILYSQYLAIKEKYQTPGNIERVHTPIVIPDLPKTKDESKVTENEVKAPPNNTIAPPLDLNEDKKETKTISELKPPDERGEVVKPKNNKKKSLPKKKKKEKVTIQSLEKRIQDLERKLDIKSKKAKNINLESLEKRVEKLEKIVL